MTIMPRDEVRAIAEKHTPPLDDAEGVVFRLARSLLAAHDEIDRLRADAQAAVALVVERAAAKADRGHGTYCRARGRDPENYVSAFSLMAREIRTLAPTDGLALVAELRELLNAVRDQRDRAVGLAETFEADRDRLAADNARLAAHP